MPDYTFTIKTPAELAGVEKAIARFEQLRGEAKANGQEFAELDRKLATAKASVEAYNAAQAATAAPTKQAADESERYEQALLDMSRAQHEAAAAAKQEAIAEITAGNAARVAGEENAAAGEKTKNFAQQSGELKKAINELSQQFPVAGLAIRALASPIAATLTIAIGFFVAIKRQIAETNIALDEMAAVNARSLSNFAENFRAAQNEASAANKEFIEGLSQIAARASDVAQNVDAAVAAIRRQATAQLELNNAAQAEALAEVNTREERKQITPAQAITQRSKINNFYEAKAVRTKNQSDEADLALREQQLSVLQATRNQITGKSASGLDEDARNARIKTLREQAENAKKLQEDLENLKAKAQAKVDNAVEGQQRAQTALDKGGPAAVALGFPEALAKQQQVVAEAIAEVDALSGRIAQAKQLREKSEARAADFEGEANALSASKSKAETLDQQIADLTRSIKELRDTYKLNRSVREQKLELNRSTRSFDTERELLQAEEELRRKTKLENERKAREAEREIRADPDINPDARRRRRRPSLSQADVPQEGNFDGPVSASGNDAVASAFQQYHEENLTGNKALADLILKFKGELADSNSSLRDAANNV